LAAQQLLFSLKSSVAVKVGFVLPISFIGDCADNCNKGINVVVKMNNSFFMIDRFIDFHFYFLNQWLAREDTNQGWVAEKRNKEEIPLCCKVRHEPRRRIIISKLFLFLHCL
jgi:transposase